MEPEPEPSGGSVAGGSVAGGSAHRGSRAITNYGYQLGRWVDAVPVRSCSSSLISSRVAATWQQVAYVAGSKRGHVPPTFCKTLRST